MIDGAKSKLQTANKLLLYGSYFEALKLYEELAKVETTKNIVQFNIEYIKRKIKFLDIGSENQDVQVLDDDEKGMVSLNFDAEYYLQNNQDVREAGIDPFVHYYHHGWKEGRDPNEEFNIKAYLTNNLDIKRANIEPYGHYLKYGKNENRRVQPTLKNTFNLPYDIDRMEKCVILPTSMNYRGQVKNKIPKVDISVGIHLHVHYLNGVERLINKIAKIREKKHLFISCTSELIKNELNKIYNLKKINTTIRVVENRGRDIAPMILDFKAELVKYDVCLHLHNKQSIEKDRGLAHAWSNNMLQTLLYDDIYVSSILNIFKNSESRVICPLIYEPIREQMVWGKNKKLIQNLYEKGFSKKFNYNSCPLFPAGSFYWFRPVLLEELSSVVSGIEEFPVEPIPDDGTLPHALERYIGILEQENKSEVIQIRPLDAHVKLNDQLPKVSIIIPVFNCEKYLFDSINSCLQQDINIPVEIIIVDNCSTDHSLDISHMYETIYIGKVKVIQEEKKGAGVARNSGIEFARGDFLIFLDADDILPPWAIRTLWDAIKSDENTDFVAGSLRFFSEIDYGFPIPHGASGEIAQINNEDILSEDWNRLITDFGPCAKLYRRSFLKLNNLYFPHGNFEDNFFVCNAYNKAIKIKIVKNTVYLYRKYQSREGLTQSTRNLQNDVFDQINVFLETLNSIGGSSSNEGIVKLNKKQKSIIMKLKEKCDHLIANSKYDLQDLFYMANEKQKNNIELYMEIK